MQVTRETHGGRAGPSSRVLLERERELEAVERALERLDSGRGRALVIRGGPGAGHSSLLRALRERAEERGIGERYAEAAPTESGFPYALIKRLLVPAAVPSPSPGPLSLLPGEGGEPGAAELGAAVEGLQELVAEGPRVLVVDEAQWADAESKSCIEAIVRRLEDIPAVIAIAVPEGGTESADRWVTSIERASASRALRPAPLSVAAVRTMIDSRLDAPSSVSFAAACHRVSGGNPFVLGELLARLQRSEVEPVDASIFELERSVPAGVRNFALERLALLAPACGLLAEAVAILGPGSALQDAARLAGLDGGDAERAADGLATAQILSAEMGLEFAQPLVGSAIYEEIPPHRRGALHLEAAGALAERDADAREVAEHLCRTRPRADEWVVEMLREAARRCVGSEAAGDALRYLKRADAEPPQSERGRFRLELGALLAEAGDLAAGQVLADALAELDPGERRDRASLELATHLCYSGEEEEGLAVLDCALAEETSAESRMRRPLNAMRLVFAAFNEGVRRQAGDELRELASGDPPPSVPGSEMGRGIELAAVALEKAMTCCDAAEATAAAEGAIDELRTNDPRVTLVGSRLLIALALLLAERPRSAERVLDELIESRAGAPPSRTACLSLALRALTRLHLGALVAAEQDADEHLRSQPARRWPPFMGIAAAVKVKCRLACGDLEGARRATEIVAVPTAAESLLSEPLRDAMALFHLANRDPCATITETLATARRQALWGPQNPVVPYPWRSRRALAIGWMGDVDEAIGLARADLDAARSSGLHRASGVALHTLALLAEGPDRCELLAEAADELRLAPAPIERAAVQVDLGAELRRAGERSRARGELRRGLRLARGCGAEALISRATIELEASGANREEVASGPHAELTPSERRVAAMAAQQGTGNREIAETLYVTVKTVEFHLTRAYRKLDITSRSELADALAAAGGEPDSQSG